MYRSHETVLIIQILKAMAIRYFDLQNHGQLFSSLLAEVSFLWYSSGGRKRALCHRPKQTLMKPNTLVDMQPLWTMLCKTHASCIVNWLFLESPEAIALILREHVRSIQSQLPTDEQQVITLQSKEKQSGLYQCQENDLDLVNHFFLVRFKFFFNLRLI